MDNSQNIKKTENNPYGQIDLSDMKYLKNKTVYTFAIKKTEKLITALYMVTDCMESEDAIKNKLRLLGIELLSYTHRLPLAGALGEQAMGSEALARIYEIFSLIEIASTLGYISEMNSGILKKEFNILADELGLRQKSQKLVLGDELFFVEKNISNEIIENKQNSSGEISANNFIKDKNTASMSFTNNSVFYGKNEPQKRQDYLLPKRQTRDLESLKKDRTERILKTIKDSSHGQSGVSIKDISSHFTDCSEKTIQRELNDLVLSNKIKKIGEKRWSKYATI